MPEINDIEQVQKALGSMYLSRKDIKRLRDILKVKEERLDTNRKSFLTEEEEKHFHKCTEHRIEGDKVVCPNCGSISTVRNGAPRGRQRYFCKDCKKTFGDTVGTVLYHSRLTLEQWKGLIEKTLMGASVRQIALDMELAKNTVLYNRHRLCSVLLQLKDNTDNFPSVAEGDEYYLPLSFKDKNDSPRFFIEKLGRMPYLHCSREDRYKWVEKHMGLPTEDAKELVSRLDENERECNKELRQFFGSLEIKYPHLLSLALNKMEKPKVFDVLKTLDEQQKKKRSISNHQVCILSCVDVNKNHYLQPVCVGRIEPRHIEEHLLPHLTEDTILVTDSHRAYKTVANRHKIPLRQIPSGKHTSNGFNLAHVNSYHSRISAFFKKYVEVASKYVDHVSVRRKPPKKVHQKSPI